MQRSTLLHAPGAWFASAVLAALCSSVGFAQPISTHTALSAEVAPTATGSKATFTVHISPLSGNTGGIVTIVDGTRELGSALVDSNGDATLETTELLPGSHSVHALYSGTDTFAQSLSADVEVTAEAAPVTPNFSASISSKALNVSQGSTITAIITLTPLNGFSNYVSLSCTGLPADSTCTFLPVNVFVSGSKETTSVLSIETYGPTGPDAQLRSHSPLVLAFVFPGILGLAGITMRRRGTAWRNVGLLLLVLSSLGSITGCAQRYHYLNRPPQASTGTPLGVTSITIEAQAVSGVVVTTQLIQNVLLTVKAAS